MSSPLVVNVAELLRRAGSVREIDRQIESEIFKFDDARIIVGSQVQVSLTLEALTDGARVVSSCDQRSRCLSNNRGAVRST